MRVALTLAEFNSIHFTKPTATEKFPVADSFGDGAVALTTHGKQRLHKGMALLTVGKWSLLRTKLATVAAMLNSRPDGDTVVLEAKFRLPLHNAKGRTLKNTH